MKKILVNYWPILIIFGLSILIIWPIFLPGYFSHHDDLQVMRIFEMKKCFEDLQIPCRWVPDMGFGNGYPLFNYYNVFPYYLGAFLSFFSGFILSAKLLFLIAAILAPISMYLLASELFGVYPGLLSATLYMFAPYRALDIYVRGAISESFAIAIIPLVFYFGLKISKDNFKKNILGLSLSMAAFLTSHNILTILFSPLLLIFFTTIFWGKKMEFVKSLIFSLILGFGLSAFFIIPAYFEKNLVQIENLTKLDLDFRAHFVTLYQLFLDRSFGYGASIPGGGDTISFQIGYPHWILAFFSAISFLSLRKKGKTYLSLYLIFLLFFIFSILMTHNKSAGIWENLGILRFVQFPWRFLALAIFTSSILGGFLIFSFKQPLAKISIAILIIVTVFLNWNYFKPDKFYFNLTDKEKLSGELWETQQKASILDYLPHEAVEPREKAQENPIVSSGQTDIQSFKKQSNRWELKVNAKSTSRIILPVLDFPLWKVYQDKKEIEHTKDNIGRISLDLQQGAYILTGRFEDTFIRKISNIITLISIVLLLYIIFYKRSLKTSFER